MARDFDDLLSANAAYAAENDVSGFDGIAKAGVLLVTCMDSRIQPLEMLGLALGDAKIVRNPGGRVTSAAMDAIVLGVHLLEVERILIVPHTRCAVASSTEPELRQRLEKASGLDTTGQSLPVVGDQQQALAEDVEKVRSHRLVPDSVAVGGFLYDVDTGLLERYV